MRKRSFGKSALSILLAVIMVLEMVVPHMSLFAAENYTYRGGAGKKVSDLDTSTKYSESLGDNASTEYAGRIWTDKSVYTDDVTFETFGGGTTTIKLNEGENLGEDFLIAYSSLATSESISGHTQAPVDVVLIIDISGSMSNASSNMDNGYSRIYNTVQAANNAIDKLMALNAYTRVAVVAFSSNAQVLLPLDRYTKKTKDGKNVPYFSLNRTTGSNNNTTWLSVNAINSANNTVENTVSVQGGTNIQMGLYEGMNILAQEKNTQAIIDGAKVQRAPSVILLSDGSPTYSSNSKSWWKPDDNNSNGPGDTPYAGNGMKAILVGSYMKDAIDRNYKVADTAFATTVYTVGMGITGLDDTEKNLAYMTLNPGKYWNDESVTNTMKTTIKTYWKNYTANDNTGKTDINVGRREWNSKQEIWKYYDAYYSLTHPTTGYDVDPVTGYDYVDDYYDADNAAAVTDVFNAIVSNISISAPQVPTELKGGDPISDGYITYTDPIGAYMEVKDVKAIVYAGETFTTKETVVNGNTTTYIFSGTVDSAVYGHQELKNILITVETVNGAQTLVIKIPASVIPLRVNEVALNADGSVKTHTNNGAFPARIIYSVGLQSEILKESDDGVVYVDKSKVSTEYLEANTNDDGTINFYSNVYTNTNIVNGATAGDATVEFEPAHTNGFYYILSDMPIYKDAAFTQQVAATEGLEDDTVYYYKDEYYHGSSVEVDAIERTGAQLKRTTIKTGEDGYLYRAAGSPRLNRILRFEGTKVLNATHTAEDFYAPTFVYAAGSSDAYEGKFVIYQGNNGTLSLVAGGNLEISKTVDAAAGLTAPDKTFEFTIALDGTDVNAGTYDYVIVDAAGGEIGAGTISASNNKIYLKDGQKATIFSLPPGATYEVIETPVDGFGIQVEGATGTIVANNTSVATFINTYQVTPVTYPTQDTLKGTKVLERPGNVWTEEDVFTFLITPYNDAPLPNNYDADTGVVVDGPDSVGGNTATFDFGSIQFTAPGVYRYTIVEKEPENHEYLPGMSYSRALYRVVITVVDNGDGTLKVTSSDIQKLYTDDAEALFTYDNDGEIVMNNGEEGQDAIVFTNTYNAEAVTRVPVALKEYVDYSGQNPLVSGMFEFELKALGYVDEKGELVNDITNVPMPEGSVNGVITTTNEGHNITFPAVTFTQNDIPAGKTSVTFRYQMSEIAGSVNGMEYDDTVYTIDVLVSIDTDSHILNVDAIYPNDTRIVTFRNTYTPYPVSGRIEGSKTLNGRDMKENETFEFVLGANAATSLAIRNGEVVVPESTVSVADGKDGVPKAFSFENIQFKKAGTYVFTVTETLGNAAAMLYDDTVYTITIVVDDTDQDGYLEIVSNSNDTEKAAFVNTYTSEFGDAPISLRGTKNLTGKTLLQGEFYFDIVEYLNGQQISERYVTHTEDTQADADGVYSGNINFLENVIYNEAGTYEYVITEQIPETKVGGTTYDESKYRYTVIVEDNQDGKLIVKSATLEKATSSGWNSATEVVFNNTYVPNPVTAQLPLIQKVISGDRSEPLKNGEFRFEIAQVYAEVADGMTLPTQTVVSNAANGDVVFGDITFTKAGTYVVSVKEIIPDDADKVAGITYSTQEITATYQVVDDRNGVLTAVLTQYVGGDTIINEYNATPGTAEITIEKIFTGRDWLATDKFAFEIAVLDTATKEAIANGDIEIALDEGSDEIATKTIDAKGETVSGVVKVNKVGTYKFMVQEVAGTIAGVSYDTTPREVVITATDDSANAQIRIAINGADVDHVTLTFTNTYDADSTWISGEDTLVVKKNFTGRKGDLWKDTDLFVFHLEAADATTLDAVAAGDVVLPDSTQLTVSNGNKENAHFGNIVFHKEGTYQFKVTEQQGTLPGVTYDLVPRVITVNVTDDPSLGSLVATVAEGSDELTFHNVYSAEASDMIELVANKKVTPSEGNSYTLTGGEFSFVIEGTEGAPMPETTTATNAADGSVTFGKVQFTQEGTYAYTIREVQGDLVGFTYDGAVYTVIVEVTDDSATAKLKTSVEITDNNGQAAEAIFENRYSPKETSAIIFGNKKLESKYKQLEADLFAFSIKAVTQDAPMPEQTTIRNTATGTFQFDTISYNKVGIYQYEITEVNLGEDGYTYDDAVYTVTVTVTDEGDGQLQATVEGIGTVEAPTIQFVNQYQPAPAEVTVDAVKRLAGRELKENEFRFVLKDAEGNILATATNAEDGTIVFEPLVFTEAGIYMYTIAEESGTLEHVTYDATEYAIAIEVTDDGKGKLVASDPVIQKTGSEDAVAEILFENIYTAPKPTPTPPTDPSQSGSHTPKTDDRDITLWYLVLAASVVGMTATVAPGKKKKCEK